MMCTTKSFLTICYFLLSFIGISQAQEHRMKTKEIGFSVGLSTVKMYEGRYSSIPKSFRAPTFGFQTKSITDHAKNEFVFNYTLRSKVDQAQLLDYRIHRPDFYFSHQRKTSFGWIGAHINLSTLLTFPTNNTGHFTNSPISYTMAATVGPSISINESFGEHDRWEVNADAHIGLASYVIRPAYAHPYPDDFLEPEVFTPTREGMAPKLLTSGRVHTIDKYQSMKVKLGVFYLIGSQVKIGIQSTIDYQKSKGLHDAEYLNHAIAVSSSYIY